jgi:hypothetical protein
MPLHYAANRVRNPPECSPISLQIKRFRQT